jgi:hypothetical protein
VFKHIELSLAELLDVEILDALVVSELSSHVLVLADLTENVHFRALLFDVLEQLRSRHVLKLLPVADVAAKFRAAELGMSL